MKLRYYILLALALTLFAFTAKSATSYTVYNVPPMRLSVGISGSQTVGIKLSAPIRNGESVSYPALTGGILQLKNARFEEHIYYASGSVAASTLEVTLYGVVRGYCWNLNSFASCEAGRVWAKGTETTLVNDMRLFNFSMKRDIANVTTGSGSYRCGSTSQPCLFAGGVTTVERDAFTYGTASGLYPEIFNTTTSTRQYWNGSAWINYGSGATVNATEAIRGAVELANFTEVSNMTLTGSTNGLLVLTPRHLTRNGTSSGASKIPLLDGNGLISLQMGGNGTGGVLGIGTGAILVYQKMGTPRGLVPTATNQVIVSTDGVNWNAGAVPTDVDVLTGSLIDSNTLTNNTADAHNFNQTGSLTTAHLNTRGKMFRISVAGSASADNETVRISLKLGGTSIGSCTTAATTATSWVANFIGTVRIEGASGVIQVSATCASGNGSAGSQGQTTSFNTTVDKTVNIGAAGSSAKDFTMTQFIIESLSQ